LLPVFEEQEKIFHIKELNEEAEAEGLTKINTNKIKTIINFWAIKNWIKRQNLEYSKNHVAMLCLHPKENLKEKLEKRHELARFTVEFLYEKSSINISEEDKAKKKYWSSFRFTN
jgi:ATP-dependent DNA helicase RecQ